MTYSWDANKNKTGESIAGTMIDYGFTIPAGGYDAEDRLVGGVGGLELAGLAIDHAITPAR